MDFTDSQVNGAVGYTMTLRDGAITLSRQDEGLFAVATIPAAIASYWGRSGLIYVFPREGADPYHAPADDLLDSGRAWVQLGVTVPCLHREAAAFAVGQVARDQLRTTGISPKIEDGLPPLSPPLECNSDGLAWMEWGWLAGRLAPMGRLTVGAALAAPWLESAGGIPTLWSMVGEGGTGKTLLLDICASIYGDPTRWSNTFAAQARGLTSLAQRHSYYPLMLDEVSNSRKSAESALFPIILGAQPTRAHRSGRDSGDNGGWHSLAFLASTTRLDFTHEMWDRRLIEVDAAQLWQPRPADQRAESEWWSEIASALKPLRGAAWEEISSENTPGTDTALSWMEHVKSVPLPGAGNFGRVAQLAVAGCQWLAEWTNTPAWTDGIADAATVVCQTRQLEGTR